MTPHSGSIPGGVPGECTVSVRVARALVDAVERAGVPAIQLLRAAQLEPERLAAAEARIPRSKVYELCELALDLTGDPALGLHWTERLTASTFAPISHLIAHAASLRQGLESIVQFYRLLSDQAGFELVELEDKVTVRCTRLAGESLRMQRFSAEMMVGGLMRCARGITGHARAERICFEYAAPGYRAEYERLFGPAVLFEQPFTGIVFDRALLETSAPHRDDDVREALQALAERRLMSLTQGTPYALRVRELLVREGWQERADMDTVARALGLSVRSLRRRLAAEGTSYNQVFNEALAIVAKQFLRDKHRTIQETAYEMGFSDTSTFHRAFKRWAGTTPSAYRQAQRKNDGL